MKRKISKKLIIVGFILLIILLVIVYILVNNPFAEVIYSIDTRVENVKNTKTKDDINSYHTIGWLRVQGTNIDTPIIAYSDSGVFDEFLIKNNYLWNEIDEEKIFNKVTIFGHNIMNLSANPEVNKSYFTRFDDLMSFVYPEFVEKNKYIQYTVNGKEYLYKIYAVGFYDNYEVDEGTDKNYTERDRNELIKNAKKNSIFDFDVDVNGKDSLISLVTCTRLFGGRITTMEFVVDARMVRSDEKAINYKVVENKKYKDVEKFMKEDEEYEEET